MFRAIILPIFRSTRLCVTACGIMHPHDVAGRRPAPSWVSPSKQRRRRTSKSPASVETCCSTIKGDPHSPARLVAHSRRATGTYTPQPLGSVQGPRLLLVQELHNCARLVVCKRGSSDGITASLPYADFSWVILPVRPLSSFPCVLTLILRRSRTGTVWFYTSTTSNKRAARPKLYTKSLTRDLKLMYSRLTLVRISIKL